MRILFVNPFGIGDVLFTSPLIRALKERGHSVCYWCNERTADLLRHNECVESLFALSRGDLKKMLKASLRRALARIFALFRYIRKGRFEAALDFSLDSRYGFILRISGVKNIFGFDYKKRGRFLTGKIKINGFSGRHMVDFYAELLSFIDADLRPGAAMELGVGREDAEWAESFLSRRGLRRGDILVGMAPGGGSSWGGDAFRKRWPKDRFARVADRLSGEYTVILLGSREERDICDYIYNASGKRPLNLCGRTALGRFAAVLKRCRLLITNDGGPLHMASALGVRTVSIFGPVDEKVYGPYPPSEKHTIITSGVGCRPCYKDFRYPLCQNRICLDSIEPSTVIEAARRILE